jgi:hypothetical protein
MLLYNITVGIDKDVEQIWLNWVRENLLIEIMDTGLFSDSKMYRILHDNDDGTVSYSIQLFAVRIENITEYLHSHAPRIIEAHRQKFMNRHVVFQTLLEEV